MVTLLATLPVRAEVLVAGSSTILPIVKRTADTFTAQTGIRVHVTGGGSDHGIKTAAAGSMQVGMVSRALRAGEARLLVAHTIGLDGVAVFVNESNGITELTKRQVADIYAGRVNQWRDIDPAAIDGRVVGVGKWTDRSTRGFSTVSSACRVRIIRPARI